MTVKSGPLALTSTKGAGVQLPPYTKTVAGAVVLLAAGVALKLKLVTLTDAAAIATAGLSLMGLGIRHGVEGIRKDFEGVPPTEEPLTKDVLREDAAESE